jgi:hypothetical protein
MKQSCADQPPGSPGTLPTIRQKQLHKSRQGTMCPGCGREKGAGAGLCFKCWTRAASPGFLPFKTVMAMNSDDASTEAALSHLDANPAYLPESWPPVLGDN